MLKFRHFVRHAYAVAWDPARLGEIELRAAQSWPAVQQDLLGFIAVVERLIA